MFDFMVVHPQIGKFLDPHQCHSQKKTHFIFSPIFPYLSWDSIYNWVCLDIRYLQIHWLSSLTFQKNTFGGLPHFFEQHQFHDSLIRSQFSDGYSSILVSQIRLNNIVLAESPFRLLLLPLCSFLCLCLCPCPCPCPCLCPLTGPGCFGEVLEMPLDATCTSRD